MFYYIIHFFECYFNLGFKMLLFLIILLIIQIIKRKLAFKSKRRSSSVTSKLRQQFLSKTTRRRRSSKSVIKTTTSLVSFSVDTFLDVQPEDYESVDSWPVESKLVIVPLPGPHLVKKIPQRKRKKNVIKKFKLWLVKE